MLLDLCARKFRPAVGTKAQAARSRLVQPTDRSANPGQQPSLRWRVQVVVDVEERLPGELPPPQDVLRQTGADEFPRPIERVVSCLDEVVHARRPHEASCRWASAGDVRDLLTFLNML